MRWMVGSDRPAAFRQLTLIDAKKCAAARIWPEVIILIRAVLAKRLTDI